MDAPKLELTAGVYTSHPILMVGAMHTYITESIL